MREQNEGEARILVTGSRAFANPQLAQDALRAVMDLGNLVYNDTVMVHGAARGADAFLADAARQAGLRVEAHPADWNQHGKRAGFLRNRKMVDLGADLMIAFPLHTQAESVAGKGSKGTWNAVELANKAGIPVFVVWGRKLWAYGQDAQTILAELTDEPRFIEISDAIGFKLPAIDWKSVLG